MEKLLNFLFRKTNMKPQLGFAGLDKKAWLWLPGNKDKVNPKTKQIIQKAPIRGCSQVAYTDWFKPMSGQEVEVCWFGLDIDQEDNEINLEEWSLKYAARHKVSMVRTSCGGKGVHMIWVLKEPIKCLHRQSGLYVKQLAERKKQEVEEEGIHVCQANKRMFWLIGGKNRTIYESVFEEPYISSSCRLPDKTIVELIDQTRGLFSPGVQRFVDFFKNKGIFKAGLGRKNKVYIGDAVKALRELGETVYTKSPMSGNGNINGYIDIFQNTISLWSYADGHNIWSYTDVEGIFC